MARYTFMMRLRGEEVIPKYERKHAEIGAEILDAHRRAGIRNYSIHRRGLDLFGYFEADDPHKSLELLLADQAMEPWFAWAEPLMEYGPDGKPKFMELSEVFYME